jgi:hypothetical protein
MRRRIWFIAIVTAFFVLHAPLCVLACVEGPSPEATAAEHSCHDENSNSSPSEQPSSQSGCGCEPVPEALASQTSDSEIGSLHLHVSPIHIGVLNVAGVRCEPSVVRNTDLPPPDILLLKSTLIL